MFFKVSVTDGVQFADRENFRAFKPVVEGRRTKLDALRQALAEMQRSVALFASEVMPALRMQAQTPARTATERAN